MNLVNSIIHETAHYLAINKPAGLIVEENPFEKPTVESLARQYLSGKYRNPYIGIIHRLDRVTSGILLLAKKRSSLKKLNEQFSNRTIQKTYLAVVEKEPPLQKQTLQHWLVKDHSNKIARIFDKKMPESHSVVLHYFQLAQLDGKYLLKITPQTGKFHQIRAQLAHIGCPIAGDLKYGAQQQPVPGTIALHAWQLAFKDPVTSEPLTLKAPWPENKCWKEFVLPD